MGRQDGQAEDVINLVERLVGFTPAQAAVWSKLASSIRVSEDSFCQDCACLEEAGELARAPQQLVWAEVMMVAGLVAVRPAPDRRKTRSMWLNTHDARASDARVWSG